DGNRRFSDSFNYFATAGVDAAPLHALAAGMDGPNSSYSDTGGFFNQTYRSSNYWVDVSFSTSALPTPTPTGTPTQTKAPIPTTTATPNSTPTATSTITPTPTATP